jgi:histidinol-phosphate aminotransferase
MKKVDMNIEQLVRPNIRTLKPYSSARSEFKGTADIFLDANENPFDTGFNRYPDPLQWALKKRIGALKGVDPAHIFLGNGSDEAIDLLLRIFCEPQQDFIITLPPTYGMYKVSADISNVAIQEVPLSERFQPNVEAILEAGADPRAKLLFLCSPNNPTGNSMNLEKVEQLIREFEGIVVIDEAYIDFSSKESFIHRIEEFDKLVVLQTFSKAWGLAGIRLGMAFAQEAIIQLFNKVKPPYNINQLTQRAAIEALDNQKQQEAWVHKILGQRTVIQQFLAGLEYVERIYPSDANFVLVKVSDPNDLYRYLVDKKIIVRNRSNVLLCEGCLRISVGTPKENEKLFAAMLDYGS